MTQTYHGDHILIYGAQEHNLKNINVGIPRNTITAITGVSGAGKSSLAFDTLLSEAHRKFFFTLSHYFRQFLPIKNRAKVRKITGISPAIGLSQYETRPSSYASLATMTDLGELFGVLFSKYSVTFCPKHLLKTQPLSLDTIAQQIQKKYANKLVAICAPIVESKKGSFRKLFEEIAEKGFLKVYCDKKILTLNPIPDLDLEKKHTIKIIVDYINITEKSHKRLINSLETATKLSDGYIEVILSNSKGEIKTEATETFAIKGGCPTCGYSWPKLDSRYFSANSLGKCSFCSGLGQKKSEPSELRATHCKSCQGTGISNKFQAIKFHEVNIYDIYNQTIGEILEIVKGIKTENNALRVLLEEIIKSLKSLSNMGLDYLSLARKISSLSLGEHQRARLSGILSQELTGIIYILDEPSQGLHSSEIKKLYEALVKLKNKRNTIILVDHDPYLLKKSDWIIDLGPTGGRLGGFKSAEFKPTDCKLYENHSLTAKFLYKNEQEILFNLKENSPPSDFIEIIDAHCHNLKIKRALIKKKSINVISGVSGSGKTSLILYTLYNNLKKILSNTHNKKESFSFCEKIKNIENITECYLIDRMPLAKTSASITATYLGLFTPIRELFASIPQAKIAGLGSKDFSLRTGNGRCSDCLGKGVHILEMKFLEDTEIKCSLCDGSRYKVNVLAIKYKNKTIADILDMSIDEAYSFFCYHKKIKTTLEACKKIGLGYLTLGQTSSNFSGGEAQRLKIVPFLLKSTRENKIFILDEPTRGLHEYDIDFLLSSLKELVKNKATVIIIEHHLGIIQKADWLIDLGPGSAQNGGKILYQGEASGIINCKESKTASFLKRNYETT